MSKAFGITRTSQIHGAITNMRNKARVFTTIESTSEEVLNAFVHAEDRDLLIKAAALVQADTNQTVSFNWPLSQGKALYMMIRVTRGLGWLTPAYATKGRLTDDCPDEFRAKLNDLANRIADIEYTFGMMYDMFNFLNGHCSSPEQVRFYFGGIVTLLKSTGDEQAIAAANKLRENKMPRSLPRIATEMRDFSIKATRRVSMVTLLPDKHPTPVVTVASSKPQAIPLPWKPSQYGTIIP